MSGNTITNTVTSSVILGSSAYPSPLTVASSGDLSPSAYDATGVTAVTSMSGLFLDNYGDISGGRGSYSYRSNGGIGGSAVQLAADDSLENKGTISGGPGGTGATGGLSKKSPNTSGGSGGVGVRLANGDILKNSGTIIGGNGGTGGTSGDGFGTGGPGGPGGIGVYAPTGAYITNSGLIVGGTGGSAGYGFTPGPNGIDAVGIYLNSGDLTNSGTIVGEVDLSGNGTVTDSGLILGESNNRGVLLESGTLIVGGTISGGAGKYAISSLLNPTLSSTIVLYPQAVISGFVRGNNTSGIIDGEFLAGSTELVLASTSSIGTLSGLESKFTGISGIRIAYGGSWVIEENATYLNFGLNYNPITITPGIPDFAPTDTFIVDGFQEDSYSYSSNLSSLELANGSGLLEQIELSGANDIYPMGALSTADFIVETGGGNTTISLNPIAPCFLNGTRIHTSRGKIPIERLKIGDFVKTMHGGERPIKWIGKRRYDGRFCAGNHFVLPILIKRHAISKNVPSRDLFVSPGHAVCEGGVLIPAWRLVNGVSIIQIPEVDSVSYYHIELERHDVIFAENCPVESFLDDQIRNQFQNADEFQHLYPATQSSKVPCLPRIEEGFYLQIIQTHLKARAGIKASPFTPGPLRGFVDQAGPGIVSGWAQDISAPENPVEIEISAGGNCIARLLANRYRQDLRVAGLGSGCHAFSLNLPPGFAQAIEIRRSADGMMLPFSADARAA